jgi:phosphoglycolate phosphatase
MRPGLILFDIDGTLLLSGRAGLRAMNRALQQAFGIQDGLNGIGVGGRTDSFLVSQALQAAGVPDTAEHHDRVRDLYVPMLAEEIQQPGTGHYGLMPGARALLEALADYQDLYVALLTGNYRDAATVKLSQFEIADHFEWGAFSDDSADRNALAPIARERAETYDVPDEARGRIIVIGDTPHDIDCARCAGARSIAVATGGFTIDQLREAGADDVIADLSDTEAVIALLV